MLAVGSESESVSGVRGLLCIVAVGVIREIQIHSLDSEACLIDATLCDT
jgi:hypothetical protein